MKAKTHCCFCGAPLAKVRLDGALRLFCHHCRVPNYENPVPATSLVVVDGRDHLLLVKRSVEPKIGWWCLPGGFLELGESPEDSALRELYEETGLHGRVDRLLGVVTSHSDRYHTILMIGYLVTVFTGSLKAGDDASDVAYFDPQHLPEIAFESHRHFVRQYYRTVARQGTQ